MILWTPEIAAGDDAGAAGHPRRARRPVGSGSGVSAGSGSAQRESEGAPAFTSVQRPRQPFGEALFEGGEGFGGGRAWGREKHRNGLKRYPQGYPRQADEALTRFHPQLHGRGTLIFTQFRSKRRSKSSAAPIGEAGTFWPGA